MLGDCDARGPFRPLSCWAAMRAGGYRATHQFPKRHNMQIANLNPHSLTFPRGRLALAKLFAYQAAEVRQRGMILAIEMVKNKARREPYPWQERRGLRVYRHALERGLLLRPIGSVIYFMPPYVITPEEIELMVTVAREGVELATCD